MQQITSSPRRRHSPPAPPRGFPRSAAAGTRHCCRTARSRGPTPRTAPPAATRGSPGPWTTPPSTCPPPASRAARPPWCAAARRRPGRGRARPPSRGRRRRRRRRCGRPLLARPACEPLGRRHRRAVDGRLVRPRAVEFHQGPADRVGAVKGERHLRVGPDAEDAADVADEGFVPTGAALDDNMVDLINVKRRGERWRGKEGVRNDGGSGGLGPRARGRERTPPPPLSLSTRARLLSSRTSPLKVTLMVGAT